MKMHPHVVVGMLLAFAACLPVSTLEAAPRERDSVRSSRKKERPKRESSSKKKNSRKKADDTPKSSLRPSAKRPGPVVKMPSLAPDRNEPNFDAPWPGKVVGPGEEMEFKVKAGENGPWIYETPHFEMRFDFEIGERTARTLGRLLETGYESGLALPCNSPVRAGDSRVKKYSLFVFAGQDEFVKTLGNNPIYRMVSALTRYPGIYLLQKTLPLKPDGQEWAIDKRRQPSVLKHELHHLVGKGNEDLGMWYIEGMAEYMLCTPYADGVLHFDLNEKPVLEYVTGYNEVYQGRQLGTKIAVPMPLKSFMNLGIAEFMSPQRANFNYGVALLCAYYWAHLDGEGDAARLKRYVQVLQKRQGREAAFNELAAGRSWEEIEKEFSAKYRKLGLEITFAGE